MGSAPLPLRLGLALAALPLLGMSPPHVLSAESVPAAPALASLTVQLEGIRNTKGLVHLCLTDIAKNYTDCADHPGSVQREMAATAASRVTIEKLRPGSYYLLVLHDENSNGKLDTTLGIPREGFGFSNNPALRMGPPKAKNVRFEISDKSAQQRVKLRYLL